jgi:hypothetical protein
VKKPWGNSRSANSFVILAAVDFFQQPGGKPAWWWRDLAPSRTDKYSGLKERSSKLQPVFDRYSCVPERRTDPRTPYISRSEVCWKNGNEEIRFPGVIEDKSVSGANIQLAKPIPVGTAITVRSGNRTVAGVVRRCVKLDFGSFIGISFEDNQPTGN